MPTRISDLPEYTTITGSAFVPIIDVISTSNKNKKITIDNLRKLYFTSTANTSAFTKHTPGFYYFGDNRDGNGIFTGSIANVRTAVSSSFTSTLDGPPVIKNFSNLFISRSVICKPTNRCKGLVVFVDGDATISGSLSMTARGASATGTDASFTAVNPPYLGDYWNRQLFPSSSYLSRVFAVGGSGGIGSPSPVIDGLTGTGGRSGGGGAGSSYGAPASAGGGTGTSFSGGAGGGGASLGSPLVGGTGSPTGGAGGFGRSPHGGGGAGNPGGAAGGPVAQSGGEGTGGLLILIVRGNLKIGPNGSIDANGSNGGNSAGPTLGGGGGGSGGGVVYVFYGGTLTNNGSITANGGSRGTGGNIAGNGGAGTTSIQRLNNIYPIAN